MENKVCNFVDELIRKQIHIGHAKYFNIPLIRDDLIDSILKSIEEFIAREKYSSC